MTDSGTDLLTLGRRLRHLRRRRGMTLAELATAVGVSPSLLSLLENGRREPRLTVLQSLARSLDVTVPELLAADPPSRRAAAEIALEQAQRSPLYASLGLPHVRPGPRLAADALDALVGLHAELERRAEAQAATPEEARRANAELRQEMRARNNYFPEVERSAEGLLDAVGHRGGVLTERVITSLARHLGFTVHQAADLPRSTRSVTDLRNRRVYLPPAHAGRGHDPRTVTLQALGHVVLGHDQPKGYADFLTQRVEVNYFAAALLVPQRAAVDLLRTAKAGRDIAIEDLRDTFAVSYEMAAHRFTNLATHHLGVRVHFMRVHESGTIYKAYENDGVVFPADPMGAIEGQPVCRHWTARTVFAQGEVASPHHQYTDTPSGTYWCTAQVEPTSSGTFSVSVGVPYTDVKWFRGRDTTLRQQSRCPDESCCGRPPAELAARWDGNAWPSARAHTHLLAALPPGTFPGVDDTEVYSFLEAHAAQT
ncbi:MAG TPA: helix-turn-helix domain-containing protein [Actinomycetales bacterium]|nr:helix-turn-helix domain-containing protein [Actinomycetales bacterium]